MLLKSNVAVEFLAVNQMSIPTLVMDIIF